MTTKAYNLARSRLPLEVLQQLLAVICGRLQSCVSDTGRWLGHRVWVMDGTGCSMPDTEELQKAFGNTKLVQDATNNLYAQIGNNNPTAIKIGATQITTNIYPGWQTLAAETVNGVNQVLWKYRIGNN